MDARSEAIRVTLLGRFRVSVGGSDIAFPTKKATSLFALLLLKRGVRLSRESVAAALWPDADEEHARRNLSMSLWRVRREIRALPNISLHSGTDGIQLDWLGVDVDLDRFRELVARAAACPHEERRELLEKAEATYTGDLLEGISDDWCEEDRRSLRATFEGLLREISAACLGAAQYSQAIERLERLVRLSPYDEDAHRELIRGYYMAGRRGVALSHFQAMKRTFSKELQTSPSPATVQLYEHIRAHSDWVLPSEGKERAGDGTGESSDPFATIPLIGRGDEIARMSRALDHALQGKGAAFLVCGDIGVGKTKLIETVMAEAGLRGFDTLLGACPDLEYPPPYQVFIQALWPRLRGRSGYTEGLAALAGQVTESVPSLDTPANRPDFAGRADSAMLNEYMVNLLLDSLHAARPTLLVLEDIHRIDGATEGLLASLLSRVEAARLVVVLSARRGERDSDRVIASILSAGAEAVELVPLGKGDVPRFIGAILGHIVPMHHLADFVHQRTGGVPLFMVELLKFLVSERYVRKRLDGGWALDEKSVAADSWRVPSQVLEAVRRRISRLESEARGLLAIAAVIGSDVPFELLERLLGVPEDRLIETVEHLLDSRLLVESDKGLRFPHESIRTAALSILSRTRLRKLHSRIAGILEVLTPVKTSEIAWHYNEAGNFTKAALFFESSGDKARLLHANEDAVRYYSQAISSVRSAGGEAEEVLRQLAVLLLKRSEVLDLVGNRSLQGQDIELILKIAAKLGDRHLRGQGLLLQSQVLCRMNQNADALTAASEAERLFRAAEDPKGSAQAAQSVGLVYVNLRNERKAGQAFRRSVELFKKAGDRAGEARALVHLGTVMTIARNNTMSMQYLNRAEEIIRELGDKRSLAWAIMQKGVLCRYAGQGDRSEDLLLTGVGLLEEIGDKVGEARGRAQLSCTRVAIGKLREGLRDAVVAACLARESLDIRAMILILNTNAYTSLRCLGAFARAQVCVRDAIRMASEDGGAENIATYYDTMAAILLDKGDWEGASRWGRQAMSLHKKWEGHFSFVGDEICYHLGLAYLRLGKLGPATRLLNRAVDSWRRSGDLVELIRGVSALGELALAKGETDKALEAAREVEKLLRRVDGLEQIQQVYWVQHKIYAAAGARVAARRALRKACAEIGRQLHTLKGRARRRFLAIPVHGEILREAAQHGLEIRDLGMAERDWRPASDPALRIDQRRRAVLDLIAGGDTNQRGIAERLGVSTRTVGSDVAALRREGLIGPN